MNRRQFLTAAATTALGTVAGADSPKSGGPGYASPAEAMKGPRETLLYVIALHVGTGVRNAGHRVCRHHKTRLFEPLGQT